MTSHGLIILSLIFSLPSIDTQTSSCNEELSLMKMERGPSGLHMWQLSSNLAPLTHPSSLQNPDNGVTTDLRSLTSHQSALHHRRHLRNAHGILNIIGWGTLLPIGVIIARYFRKWPMKCEDWYSLHILCQTSGYILGTIGWGTGIWLGNASKHYTIRIHRILGTIIFTFTTIQMFSICLQPKKKGRKCWEICHCILGYALIAMIIANIFQGVKNQSSSKKWKWFYVGELGVLATTAAALEILRCIKCMRHRAIVLNSSIYASQS